MSAHVDAYADGGAAAILCEITLHRYPKEMPYRRSGNKHPQPGDVAYCGHVKDTPSAVYPPDSCNCLPCLRLSEMHK